MTEKKWLASMANNIGAETKGRPNGLQFPCKNFEIQKTRINAREKDNGGVKTYLTAGFPVNGGHRPIFLFSQWFAMSFPWSSIRQKVVWVGPLNSKAILNPNIVEGFMGRLHNP